MPTISLIPQSSSLIISLPQPIPPMITIPPMPMHPSTGNPYESTLIHLYY